MPSVYDAATPILLRAGIDPSFAVRFQLLWGVQRLLTGMWTPKFCRAQAWPRLLFFFVPIRTLPTDLLFPLLSPLGEELPVGCVYSHQYAQPFV